jgi:hypothetical protein
VLTPDDDQPFIRPAPDVRPRGQRFAAALRAMGPAARRAFVALGSPSLVVTVLLLAGAACGVSGVHLLAGQGWALIAAAVILFVLAAAIARSLTGG